MTENLRSEEKTVSQTHISSSIYSAVPSFPGWFYFRCPWCLLFLRLLGLAPSTFLLVLLLCVWLAETVITSAHGFRFQTWHLLPAVCILLYPYRYIYPSSATLWYFRKEKRQTCLVCVLHGMSKVDACRCFHYQSHREDFSIDRVNLIILFTIFHSWRLLN